MGANSGLGAYSNKYGSPDMATNQTDAVIAMERCISDIRSWMLTDKLKLNDDKTEFMLIGTKQQLSKVKLIALS